MIFVLVTSMSVLFSANKWGPYCKSTLTQICASCKIDLGSSGTKSSGQMTTCRQGADVIRRPSHVFTEAWMKGLRNSQDETNGNKTGARHVGKPRFFGFVKTKLSPSRKW